MENQSKPIAVGGPMINSSPMPTPNEELKTSTDHGSSSQNVLSSVVALSCSMNPTENVPMSCDMNPTDNVPMSFDMYPTDNVPMPNSSSSLELSEATASAILTSPLQEIVQTTPAVVASSSLQSAAAPVFAFGQNNPLAGVRQSANALFPAYFASPFLGNNTFAHQSAVPFFHASHSSSLIRGFSTDPHAAAARRSTGSILGFSAAPCTGFPAPNQSIASFSPHGSVSGFPLVPVGGGGGGADAPIHPFIGGGQFGNPIPGYLAGYYQPVPVPFPSVFGPNLSSSGYSSFSAPATRVEPLPPPQQQPDDDKPLLIFGQNFRPGGGSSPMKSIQNSPISGFGSTSGVPGSGLGASSSRPMEIHDLQSKAESDALEVLNGNFSLETVDKSATLRPEKQKKRSNAYSRKKNQPEKTGAVKNNNGKEAADEVVMMSDEKEEVVENLGRKTWNFRSRKQTIKPQNYYDQQATGGMYPYSGTAKMRERREKKTSYENTPIAPHFSVSLSKKEIHSDFMAMTGKPPPAKPKGKKKKDHKRLDALCLCASLHLATPKYYEPVKNPKN